MFKDNQRLPSRLFKPSNVGEIKAPRAKKGFLGASWPLSSALVPFSIPDGRLISMLLGRGPNPN